MVVESTMLKFSIARKTKSSTSLNNLRPMFFLVTWLLSLPSPLKNKKNLTNTNYSLSQGFGDSVGSFEMRLAIFAESDDREKLLKPL